MSSVQQNDFEWMKSIKGFLIDITGVLFNSSPTGPCVIPGSIDAVKRLYSKGKVRFVSNKSTSVRKKLFECLNRLGFELYENDILMPAPAAASYIKKLGLRPHLLVCKDIVSEFDNCDQSYPKNCVVLGDLKEEFTYENLNKAFQLLINNKDSLLISLGCGKFYQRVDGPYLDLGGFAMALKYASDCKHVVIGKPEHDFFMNAINDMGLKKEEVVMIGDDIISDVNGAQRIGVKGIQVRTGKWRNEWENYYIKPDIIADNLNDAVNTILNYK